MWSSACRWGRSSRWRRKQYIYIYISYNNKQTSLSLSIYIYIYIYVCIYIYIYTHRYMTYNYGNSLLKQLGFGILLRVSNPNCCIYVLLRTPVAPVPRARPGRAAGPGSSAPSWSGSGHQGFQGYGFHLSTNHFEILRTTYGLRIFSFLFLRIGASLTVAFKQYPWNPPGYPLSCGRGSAWTAAT